VFCTRMQEEYAFFGIQRAVGWCKTVIEGVEGSLQSCFGEITVAVTVLTNVNRRK